MPHHDGGKGHLRSRVAGPARTSPSCLSSTARRANVCPLQRAGAIATCWSFGHRAREQLPSLAMAVPVHSLATHSSSPGCFRGTIVEDVQRKHTRACTTAGLP